jgi:hypothetical protein
MKRMFLIAAAAVAAFALAGCNKEQPAAPKTGATPPASTAPAPAAPAPATPAPAPADASKDAAKK